MEDLEAFLSPEQAQEAFDMLDNNGDGKLVLADIRDAVIKIYKERRNLALSLKVCRRMSEQLDSATWYCCHHCCLSAASMIDTRCWAHSRINLDFAAPHLYMSAGLSCCSLRGCHVHAYRWLQLSQV